MIWPRFTLTSLAKPSRSFSPISAIGLVIIVLAGACGEPLESPVGAPEVDDVTTIATPSTASSTTTTYAIEVVKFAEAYGATMAEANALFAGQNAQIDGLGKIEDLVGDDLIVSSAFSDYPNSDELTIFVVDDDAVAAVESRADEAGLDPAKTIVQVAAEEEPIDFWEWLDDEAYDGYEWLPSPGPHPFGAWQLVDADTVVPSVRLALGPQSRWTLEPCPVYVGRFLTSSDGTVAVTVDPDFLDCGEVTGPLDELLFRVIEENGGDFELDFRTDGGMVWRGTQGDDVRWWWDDSFEPILPVYPEDHSDAYQSWIGSAGAEMEGMWMLRRVANEDPAAPVTLYVGVSTIGFEGQCNSTEGMFAVSREGRLALDLYFTQRGCSGPTGEVEQQIHRVLFETKGPLELSIEGDTMTWTTVGGSQIIWSR